MPATSAGHRDQRRAATFGELRTAVIGGQWDRVGMLAAAAAPAGDQNQQLLAQVAQQALLHARAGQILGAASWTESDASSPGQPGASGGASDPGRQLVRAVRRNFAALDGDRLLAAALVRECLSDASSSGRGVAHLPPRNPGDVVRVQPPDVLLRVVGVARPGDDDSVAVGDAGSPDVMTMYGAVRPLPRGTAVEVVGRWDASNGMFRSQSLATVDQVPDYPQVCAAVEQLCTAVGLAAEPMQVRVAPTAELDQSVARSRLERRRGEWDAVLAAGEVFEDALSAKQLTVETLAHAHALIVGAGTAGAGHLRNTPAVIRWRRVITYRAPPVQTARSQVSIFLRDLAAELGQPDTSRPSAAIAAHAIAALTTSHPFEDGNGRVARALATWLLLRSGFRQRANDTLSTYLDVRLEEHYRALRTFPVSPWAWYQLFYDAVLAAFERVPGSAGR